MSDFEIHENPVQPSGVLGNQTTQDKTTTKVKWGTRELEQLDADANPILSELSEKTLENLSLSTPNIVLLEKHDFDSDVSNTNDLLTLKKTNSIGQPILSELNSHSELDQQDSIRPPEVEAFLKEDDFSAKIHAMTEDELLEALENPDFTEEELSIIEKKLDEFILKQEDLKEKALENLKEKVFKNLNEETLEKSDELSEFILKETSKIILKETSKITENDEKIASLGKNAVFITADGGLESLHLNPNSDNPIASFDPKTGMLSGPNDIIKNYQVGQKVKYKDEMGVEREIEITVIKKFTEEEEAAFQEYISSNYQTDHHISLHEEVKEEKGDEHVPTSSKQTKQKNDDPNPEINQTQVNEKLNELKSKKASSGFINGKSSQDLFIERLRKMEEKFKRLEEKIEVEIQKHETLIQETQRNNLSLETKKADFKSDKLSSENLEIENQYKDLLKIVNDPKRGFEIPVAVSKKIQAIEINFHKIERLVHKNDTGNINNNFAVEITSLKKQLIGIAIEMLNTSGTHVTKGNQSEGKISAI